MDESFTPMENALEEKATAENLRRNLERIFSGMEGDCNIIRGIKNLNKECCELLEVTGDLYIAAAEPTTTEEDKAEIEEEICTHILHLMKFKDLLQEIVDNEG